MNDIAPPPDGKSGSRVPLIIAVTSIVAVQAAAWLYFRGRQSSTDEQTRARLAPKGRA